MINRNFISSLHNSTNRKYLSRMVDDKVSCMKEAKKYEKNYWDGHRRYGYGGYKYIPGRWTKVAKKLIHTYKLKNGSKILDNFSLRIILEVYCIILIVTFAIHVRGQILKLVSKGHIL